MTPGGRLASVSAGPRRAGVIASTTVRLDVYSDYTCPWCYVGWARLARALARLPAGVRADVRWRPFEIHPEVPPEGMPFEDLPYTPEQWARMQRALRRSAAAEGLEVGRRPKVSNTHRALAAGAYAQAEEPDRFEAFHGGLFRAYFAEGRDLGDPGVVDGLARSCGLDAERLGEALDSGRYDPELLETARLAHVRGISGTPTFVFDDRFAAVGAQPVEQLLLGFDAALREER